MPVDDGEPTPPSFGSSVENQLVEQYMSKQISAESFVSQALARSLGTPPPSVPPGASPEVKALSAPSSPPMNQHRDVDASSTPLDGDFLQYVFSVASLLPENEQQALVGEAVPLADIHATSDADAVTSAVPQRVPPGIEGTTTRPDAATESPATRAVAVASVTSHCRHAIKFKVPGLVNAQYRCEAATAHFNIWYSLASQDRRNGVPDTDRWGSANDRPDGFPDYIDNVALALEDAYHVYQGTGFKTPQRTAVLIGALNGKIPDTNAFTLPPLLGDGSTVFMSNVGTEIYIPTHEAFHVFQYRYISASQLSLHFDDMNWWMEATAEWAAHQALPGAVPLYDRLGQTESNQYAQRLAYYLGTTNRALNYWPGLGQPRQYGAFILAEYLDYQFYPINGVLASWQHIGRGDLPIKAINSTFRDNNTSIQSELPKFAKAIYQLGPDPSCVIFDALPRAQVTGAPSYSECNGYDSEQNQFFDWNELNTWKSVLANTKRVPSTAATTRGDYAFGYPRPAHAVVPLNKVGSPTRRQSVSLGDGGIGFSDLTWAGSQDGELQVTVTAPRTTVRHGRTVTSLPVSLHVSLIGWYSYPNQERCAWDQEGTITKPGGSVTLTSSGLSGCSVVTVVLTDTRPQDSSGNDPDRGYTWTSRFIASPVPT